MPARAEGEVRTTSAGSRVVFVFVIVIALLLLAPSAPFARIALAS